LVIIFLSVVPGNLRPHVMADKHIEHFAVYFWLSFRLGVSAAAASELRPAKRVRRGT
jgi:hypothetical protein